MGPDRKSTDVRLCAMSLSSSRAHHVGDGPPADLGVRDWVAERRPPHPEELRVRAGQMVLGPLAEHEDAADGGRRVVDRHDHLGGGEALLGAAVVGGQRLGIDRGREIVLLEACQTEVGETGPGRRTGVEVRVAMPPLLVQNAFVLRAREGAPGADPNPDAPLEAHGRRV